MLSSNKGLTLKVRNLIASVEGVIVRGNTVNERLKRNYVNPSHLPDLYTAAPVLSKLIQNQLAVNTA